MRWLYFPSSLYVTGAGLGAAPTVVAGIAGAALPRRAAPPGAARAAGFLFSYAALGSLGNVCDALWINTPWDCFVLEAGVPARSRPRRRRAATAAAAGAARAGARSGLRRWLLFRVVGGFAKLRFLGGGRLGVGHAPGTAAAAEGLRKFFVILPMVHRLGQVREGASESPSAASLLSASR